MVENSDSVTVLAMLTQQILQAEQALASRVVVAQVVSSEHEIQQNFFSACPQPAKFVKCTSSGEICWNEFKTTH